MGNRDDGSDGGGDDRVEFARRARTLLHSQRQGVLSTISLHRAGYPYGSLTPYALSRAGAPLILISALAAHTQNLLADPRASLFVVCLPLQGRAAEAGEAGDPQAETRISVLGRLRACRPTTRPTPSPATPSACRAPPPTPRPPTSSSGR